MIGNVKDSAHKAVLIRVEVPREVLFLRLGAGVRNEPIQERKAIRIGYCARGCEHQSSTVAGE